MELWIPAVRRVSNRSVRGRLAALVASVGCLLIAPAVASGAYTFGPEVTGGDKATVFDHATSENPNDPQQCQDLLFIQDVPSRAFRGADGAVQLIMAHTGTSAGGHTRRLLGTTLNAVAVDGMLPTTDPRCTVIHQSGLETIPDNFYNNEWIVAPYTEDGTNIHALVHNEFHAFALPSNPPNPDPCTVDQPQGAFTVKCWYNGLTWARSTNRGLLYTRNTPDYFVASVPYEYVPDTGPTGYFQPSNIVKKGGYYYTLFRAEQHQAQQPRSCVMRTPNLDDPSLWRAYDGNADDAQDGFTVAFVDPYHDDVPNPEQHVCAPVSPIGFEGNLVYSRYFGRYMVVYPDGPNGITGVYYALSSDLVHWDPPKLLMGAPLAWQRACPNADRGIRVPSLLDPNSTERNYNTIGQTADLYFGESRFVDDTSTNPPTCRETLDRDLVRIPIRFTRKPEPDRLASLEGGGLVNPGDGFDWYYAGSSGGIGPSGEQAYDGSTSAKVRSSGNSYAVGTINARRSDGTVGWPNGTDVWYGSGFYLPTGFHSQVARVMPMRWLNSDLPVGATRYGGIVLNTDDTYRLIRGKQGGPEDNLGNTFTLPEGRWFWLEVHQKLESDALQQPLSEVFVDGKLVASSAAPNAYPDSEGLPIRAHYGFTQRSFSPGMSTFWIDRSSTSTMQRGPLGAPATPTGLTGSEASGYIILTWNASPDLDGGGYRLYHEGVDGTWNLIQQNASNGYLAVFGPASSCSRQHYRVSAYKGTGIGAESPQSEVIEVRPQPAIGCP